MPAENLPVDVLADGYIALWNETDPARRQSLLETHWTTDASYVDPMARASGHDEISALVAGVQQRFPGFRFRRRGAADAHGEQLRFGWSLGPEDAHDLIEGTDFVQLSAGRMRAVVGFLDKVPVGA